MRRPHVAMIVEHAGGSGAVASVALNQARQLLDFPAGRVTPDAVSRLVADFHLRHEQLYTFANPEADVEIVNLRLRALGLMEKLELPKLETAGNGATPPSGQTRMVHFAAAGFLEAPVYSRESLLAGHTISGPAIVDQPDTTTVIFPGQTAEVDAYGNLIATVHLTAAPAT